MRSPASVGFLEEVVEEVVPAALVATAAVVIRQVGVMQLHQGVRALGLEAHGHCGFQAAGERGHPGVLQPVARVEHDEASVVGDQRSVLQAVRQVEEPVHLMLDDQLARAVPHATRVRGIQPGGVDLGGGRRDGAGDGQFHGLDVAAHGLRFLFSMKNPWRRSRCSLQKRSYSCTQPATCRSGSLRNSSRWSRPCFSRWMRPACSSTLRCLETALRDMSKGAAISVTRAGPLASWAMMARREGWEMAPKTEVISCMGIIQPKG